MNYTVYLGDNGGILWAAAFEKFGHARQTAGYIFGFCNFLGYLCKNVAGQNIIAVINNDVGVKRQGIFGHLFAGLLYNDAGTEAFGRMLYDNALYLPGNLGFFFVKGYAFLYITQFYNTIGFRYDGLGMRIPVGKKLALYHFFGGGNLKTCAVGQLVGFAPAIGRIGQYKFGIPGYYYRLAFLILKFAHIVIENNAVLVGMNLGTLDNAACRTTDMEGTQRKLGTRFAD